MIAVLTVYNTSQIPEDEAVTIVIEDDGTLVDSEAFFRKLPSQTVFIFLRAGEKWKGGKTSNTSRS